MNSQPALPSRIAPSGAWQIAVLALVLFCGFATRLYDLTDPPLDYAPSRQLRSAIIARGIYYQIKPDSTAWQREIAQKGQDGQEMLEPEVLEYLTAFTYLLAGGEYLWIPRIYSALFWTLGGLALYALLKSLAGGDAALIGLLYYQFDPFGLLAGRTFQPDPLMTALIVLAWWNFLNWRSEKTLPAALGAGLSAGAAIFIKTTAVFFLFFGMAAVLLTENKLPDLLKNARIWLVGVLAVLPATLYHLFGFFISGELRGQLSGRLFNSSLWDQADFYQGWLSTTGKVLGHEIILIVALLGLALVKGRLRIYLLGTWLGFVVYGFAVSYYVTTHSYYLLPAIPLTAISLGAVGGWLAKQLDQGRLLWLARAGCAAVLILGMGGGYYLYAREDYSHEPGYYQEVASYVPPADRIVALSQDYGFRLAYYGWRNVYPWQGLGKLSVESFDPELGESSTEKFLSAMERFDYFIITRMGDFREDQFLSAALEDHYLLYQQEAGFRIYDLNERVE